MNKAEFIDAVAKKSGASKKVATDVVNAAIAVTEEAVKKGDGVSIAGFGSLKVVSRAARQGRNPKTGETIKIPAKKVVKFKAGKELAAAAK